MKHVTVLYEDHGVPQVTSDGPHVLALACAADSMPGAPSKWVLGKYFQGSPQKGSGNVLKKLELMDDQRPQTVIALLDLDRAPVLLDRRTSARC